MSNDALAEWLAHERLPSTYLDVIARVHVPLARYLLEATERQREPLLVGIAGSQGSGKTTLTRALAHILTSMGAPTVALSLDDFYLPRRDRQALAERVHPLFVTRGVPGTHDVTLAAYVLDELVAGRAAQVPCFDKATDDRAHESAAKGPAQIVLFEGWVVGAAPQSPQELLEPVNDLERERDADGSWRGAVNAALATDYQPLFARLHRLVFLRAPSFDVVLRWRAEQEEKLRARLQDAGADASALLTQAQLQFFIAHYERLTRHMLRTMDANSDVVITLDEQRNVSDITFADE